MSSKTSSFFIFTLVAVLYLAGICAGTSCDSPQYLELGKSETISCVFPEHFFGVLWYNSTEILSNDPLVDYRNFVKKGAGYTSGEFNIHANGSLIINHVTLEHEHTYKLVYLHSEEDRPVLINITVVVVVKPPVPFPVLSCCGNISNVCFASFTLPSLRCSVIRGRPAIPLKLVARTVNGDKDISSNTTVTSEGIGYTSRVVTADIFKFSTLLVLLVCKASPVPGILKNEESYLLAQNSLINFSSKDFTVIYIENSSRMELSCGVTGTAFIVWKKGNSAEDPDPIVLIYSVNIGEHFTKVIADDMTLAGGTSLIVPSTEVKHSGYYFCLFGDGFADGAKMYEVVVVVNPVPAYPIIDGCNHEWYCTLEAGHEGTVTCTIKGIRPLVKLAWQTFRQEDAHAISFFNNHVTVKENGGIFDVTLTSAYTWNDESRDRITIECMAPSSNGLEFHLTTTIDLLLVKGGSNPTDEEGSQNTPVRPFWIIPIIIVVLVVILTLCGIVVMKYTRKIHSFKTKSSNKEEINTLLQAKRYDEKNISDLTEQFLNQIKARYKDWYDAVQPIPYIKDRLYCVDKVFVEGGIEFLDSVEGQGGLGVWKTLETYENIFNASQVSSPRRILEGEPGYGKSTVTLQFAYDWCNPKPTSALKDVEMLILLRLRQLGGIPSIYKAIKRFILPRDTTISETDIEQILRNSKSVAVILDGFDEYPDQDSTNITDVMAIIARQMFQDFEVVTTTRSSFLPKKYPPLTKRIRLTGFDEKARRYYIRKAVVGNDDDRVRKVERHLEGNPILSDLCQVPLLFVIFAHMTHGSEQFRKLNSVTSFFRHMISCFHSHMRNKMEDENVRKYELFETDHWDLDKLAFEAFSGQSQRIVWNKDEMCQLVGQEFYDQYIRIGILIEEESVNIIDDPGTPITEVRFYHKLFCEWYAAHYLTDYLQRNQTVDLHEFLRHLDPFDVQYLYRFACGIESDSAKKIIGYLKDIEGGDKFAILCILEQTGKIDDIKETIRQLCDEGVIISGHGTLLLQRSSMQLLEIAARNEIPIACVCLYDCLRLVDLSKGVIETTSGLVFSSKIPVKKLVVCHYNRKTTEDEYYKILTFSLMFSSLRYLWFDGSAPPRNVSAGTVLSTLGERNVTVQYLGLFKTSPKYVLNLLTGRWEREDNGSECTEIGFDKMDSDWQIMQSKSEETYKNAVHNISEFLRKRAMEEKRKEEEENAARANDGNIKNNIEDDV